MHAERLRNFFLIPKKIRSKIDPVVKIGVSGVERGRTIGTVSTLIGLASEAALHELRPLAYRRFAVSTLPLSQRLQRDRIDRSPSS